MESKAEREKGIMLYSIVLKLWNVVGILKHAKPKSTHTHNIGKTLESNRPFNDIAQIKLLRCVNNTKS